MRDPALWDRLLAYTFPMSGQQPPLAEQFANKHRMNAKNAKVVVMEYRRFLYLAAVADDVVTPSPVIDAVWHLHIIDTRAYLDGLCAQIIGRVIHHAPGRDRQSHDVAYPETLVHYQREFGMAAPSRVWPSVAVMKAGRYVGLPVVLGLALTLYGTLEGGWGFMLAGLALAALPLAGWMAIGPWSLGGIGSAGSEGGPDGSDGCGGD